MAEKTLAQAFVAVCAAVENVKRDTQGQVGFKAIGKVPLRHAQNDLKGVAPAPGWLPQYDWTGWLPYEQNPALSHAQIEQQGWQATANQNILPKGYKHFIGSEQMVQIGP